MNALVSRTMRFGGAVLVTSLFAACGGGGAETVANPVPPPPVNNPPTIGGSPVTSVTQDQEYSFQPIASDADGDVLTFSVSGLPGWATFNDQTGNISGTPGDANVGPYNDISITVSDGNADTTLGPFSITVTPVNSNAVPTISGDPPAQVDANTPYLFTPTANDADGGTLTFTEVGVPGWANFNSTTGAITGTPTDADIGTYSGISITVSDGTDSAMLGPFSITVTPVNSNAVPTISGNPPAQVGANTPYLFTPTANDADGGTLTFTEVGVPGWANFNSTTGAITGTPTDVNIGTYSGISITVSDGTDSAMLGPFSITVVADNTNTAPTISGSPPTQVNANSPYSFTPVANDADGDTLTFSIVNQPTWATFDTSTGTLSGTPGVGHIGVTLGVTITVSDGPDSAFLAAFDLEVLPIPLGSATVFWDVPNTNADGSQMTDLAGYEVHYGTASQDYSRLVVINNAATSSVQIDDLEPGTWFFAVIAVDEAENKSAFSTEVSKDVNP